MTVTNDFFVIQVRYDNGFICGYAAGGDNIMHDINRAAIFRLEEVATPVRDEMEDRAIYPFEFTVVKVELKDIL